MRDITADVAVAGVAHEGVQVSAIDVDLTAGGVHRVGDVLDAVLVNPVGRGVGHHQRGEVLTVLGDFRVQVINVDVALLITGDHNDLHTRQDGAGRVGAVSARRNQADVAVSITAGEVVAANRKQARVFTLASRVGLQRHRVVTGEFGEPGFQVRHQYQVARHVGGGGEGVEASKFGPGHRLHFGGGVELHGAATERNHAPVERVVLIGELLEVAHHLSLRAVDVEHRVLEITRTATEGIRKRIGLGLLARVVT